MNTPQTLSLYSWVERRPVPAFKRYSGVAYTIESFPSARSLLSWAVLVVDSSYSSFPHLLHLIRHKRNQRRYHNGYTSLLHIRIRCTLTLTSMFPKIVNEWSSLVNDRFAVSCRKNYRSVMSLNEFKAVFCPSLSLSMSKLSFLMAYAKPKSSPSSLAVAMI